MGKTVGKTMRKFWMDSKMPEDNRWHSKHQGPLRTPDRLADHFVEQLREVGREKRKDGRDGQSELAIMVRFARIMKELMESYESQANLLLKLADTGRIITLLHRSIDSALDTQGIHDTQAREMWHNHLLQERRDRLQVFEDLARNEEELGKALGDEEQQLEIVTLLRYCVKKFHDGITPYNENNEKFRDKLMPCELDTLSIVYEAVVMKTGVVADKIPECYSERRGVMDGLGLAPQTKVDWSHKIDNQTRETLVSYDVLKFGIAIFFLIAGKRNANLPSDTRDQKFDTWDKKTTERLPDVRPEFIEEGEWEVLQGLCAEDPSNRTNLVLASSKMQTLAPNTQSERSVLAGKTQDMIDILECGYHGLIEDMLNDAKTQCVDAKCSPLGAENFRGVQPA
ncbi:hypothetical protein BBJ29_003365 [Phytophthora kernoviae]|uniref:Uncharacterized protein n=1 Tax=Phytophthora kernoviae TaxID=325452 RepID=A0A3F2RLW8_9STRA|nr:hypothetical protein BBP00_00006115 [Phytophthora kernoviae]RLN67500.1 hypothetical protein BBJ29_003365 [Phytophthora kernoviae]